jgi:flagellar protein FlaG
MTIPASQLTASLSPERKILTPIQGNDAETKPEGAVVTGAPGNRKNGISADQTKAALAEINHTLQMASVGVRFELDREADILVTKVVDEKSGELIRQMPSEEALRVSKALGKLQGLLVRDSA